MKHPPAAPPLDITSESLQQMQERGESVQLVDVRGGGEYAGGRIPGAKLMPLPNLAARQHELQRDVQVVCICQSGGRSTAAARALATSGFTASSLAGGMNAWARAGLPMDKDSRAPWSLERQVRLAAGALVLLGLSLGWFSHPAFFLLSAFVGAGLMFAGATDWCGLGLLLARAPWNQRR